MYIVGYGSDHGAYGEHWPDAISLKAPLLEVDQAYSSEDSLHQWAIVDFLDLRTCPIMPHCSLAMGGSGKGRWINGSRVTSDIGEPGGNDTRS